MRKVLILLLKFYKMAISPFIGRACIYEPTCSVYAMEAIKKHGPFKGLLMSGYRILRCNPFSRGGFDPVV
ncbi:MAG: membrane protein insertion efficiency factor YidD [Fibrobacteres bacterium]|nr:membrane protein insertion efficiency factor YidD [Fibrobacterota bacterium]